MREAVSRVPRRTEAIPGLSDPNERMEKGQVVIRGADRESLVAHMQRAIRLGATREELFEVLEATLVPGGAPTFHRGLSALLEIE